MKILSLIESIPNELLLEILEHLPYGDLKLRIPLVSKRFSEILQKPTADSARYIDRVLFQDAPRPLPPINDYDSAPDVHYAFDMLDYCYGPTIEGIRIRKLSSHFVRKGHLYTPSSRFDTALLRDVPLASENATQPAVEMLVLHICVSFDHSGSFQKSRKVQGTAENGAVTVMDVMEGVAAIMRSLKSKRRDPGHKWCGFWSTETRVVNGILHLYDDGEVMALRS